MPFPPARNSAFGPDELPGYDAPLPSRVHELGHMDLTGLIALYHQLRDPMAPVAAIKNRDQAIGLIRELEAPRELPGLEYTTRTTGLTLSTRATEPRGTTVPAS